MKIPHLLTLFLALGLVAGCDDGDEELPAREPAAGAPAPSRDTAPLSRGDIAPAEEEPREGPAEEAAEGPGEPATVAARELGPRVYTVQVGAFTRDANAAEVVRRLEGAGFPVWHPDARVESTEFERVRVGALTSYGEARGLARHLRDRYRLPTWIAPVPPDTRLSPGIVEATRRALAGG